MEKTNRNSTIIRLSRFGWSQEKIVEITGRTQGRFAQIINNTNFCKINNLFAQGHTMEYIAAHFQMDLALAWAIRFQDSPGGFRISETP